MMILLTKREYNELLARCSNVDIAADAKLELLKKDLRAKLADLCVQYRPRTQHDLEYLLNKIMHLL